MTINTTKKLSNLKFEEVKCIDGSLSRLVIVSKKKLNENLDDSVKVVKDLVCFGDNVEVLSNGYVISYHFLNEDVIVFDRYKSFERAFENEMVRRFGITIDKDGKYVYWYEMKTDFVEKFKNEKNAKEYKKFSYSNYKYYILKDKSIIEANYKGNVNNWIPSEDTFNRYVKIFILNE